MQTITIIIGLPGSGKSTYIANNILFHEALICDDYHKSAINHSHEFHDSIYFSDLKNALVQGKDVVLADIAWCKKERLLSVISSIQLLLNEWNSKAEIKYLYFENNPGACKINVLNRNRPGRVEDELEFINNFSLFYHIPGDTITIPVYQS